MAGVAGPASDRSGTVISTRGLTKRFGAVRAVDGLDLDIREGDVYGFLGANGSGKTTTVRMLLGLVLATSGDISVLGEPMPAAAKRVLRQVGALVENPAAYPSMSGRANLSLFDAMGSDGVRRTRSARVGEALDRVGLGGVDRRPVKAYSLGMRQRLGLASALLRSPRLLVLDEPTNGLDPQGIRDIRALLLELNAKGTTIFLSSHLLAEVEQMCTRVGVVDRGRLVMQDRLDALQRLTGRVRVRTPDAVRAKALLDGQVESHDGDSLLIRVSDSAELNRRLVEGGIRVTELAPERLALEDIVLAATSAGSDRIDRQDTTRQDGETLPTRPPTAVDPIDRLELP
ncbi:MAG TPA: ABC transporter ATP-binding protein [Nocardioidaceae bacterium]|nr:ABC transporter ATP-binding protein [Nocardioidaceae bacterium]